MELQIFLIFIPKLGEDEPILTSILFNWVETTNQCIVWVGDIMTSVYQHEMHQLWLSHPSFTSQTSQWFVFFSMGVWDRPFATDTIFCGKKNGIVSTIYRSSDLMMVLNSCASWEYVVYPCLSHYLISTDNLIIIVSHIVLFTSWYHYFVCVCVLYVPTGTIIWNSANGPNPHREKIKRT